MKAIVVEIKNKDMILMDTSGQFVKRKYDKKSQIGDEILLSEAKVIELSRFRKFASIAAMLLITLSFGVGAAAYYTPYSYVDVDINPSLELVLNRFEKVIDVNNLNEDSKKIASNKSEFKNKGISEAIEKLVENAEKQNIISKDKENDILFTVSSKDENTVNKINSNLKTIAQKKLEKLNKKYEILLAKDTIKNRNRAINDRISPGRVILYEKLKEVKPDATLEEVLKQPVRETLKTIKQYRDENKNINNGNGKDTSKPATSTNTKAKNNKDSITENDNSNKTSKIDAAKQKVKTEIKEIKEKIQEKVQDEKTKAQVNAVKEKVQEKIQEQKEKITEKYTEQKRKAIISRIKDAALQRIQRMEKMQKVKEKEAESVPGEISEVINE